MVHSGILFWQIKVCKRRRFLSDIKTGLFLSQSCQDPVRPEKTDSGGASLHPLTSWHPALKGSWLLSESGNIENRLLASGGGSKWSLGRMLMQYNTWVRDGGVHGGRHSAQEAPL